LIIIGSNLEKLMGPARFAAFYLLSGIIAGGVITYMYTAGSNTGSILFGAAPSVAGVISGLLFIQLRRPRWFDNTDVRVMWLFVAVYLIVIFGGLVLNLSPSISLVVYISGLIAGALLSPVLMPKDRHDI
jgi:membrane associated rhomboid family serine protease